MVRLILRDHRLYLQAGRQAEGMGKLKMNTHIMDRVNLDKRTQYYSCKISESEISFNVNSLLSFAKVHRYINIAMQLFHKLKERFSYEYFVHKN